eukprot:Lankesteria_metandrocarpae@DN5516_c0_g1_i1.p1
MLLVEELLFVPFIGNGTDISSPVGGDWLGLCWWSSWWSFVCIWLRYMGENSWRWGLLIFELFFSSTVLTIFIILLVVNPVFRRLSFLFFSWGLWLIISVFFQILRFTMGLYHFLRIAVNLWLFAIATLCGRCYISLRCISFRENATERAWAVLETVESYDEWLRVSQDIDNLTGGHQWRAVAECPYIDHQLLAAHLKSMERARKSKDWRSVISLLQSASIRGFGGINNPDLFAVHALGGTKMLVEDFVNELCLSVEALCSSSSPKPQTSATSIIAYTTTGAAGTTTTTADTTDDTT